MSQLSPKPTVVASPTPPTRAQQQAYWRTNLRYVAILLSIWASVSFGAGIFFADALNAYHIGGAPAGFWMAQQGSIYVFVGLIFVYVGLMNRLDARTAV